MSDTDGLDLAGVIGTWMAVFLAIVALVGVLPVILLYRHSRTKKAKALALLDDPSGNYVINTFRIANLGYRKIGKLIDLVSPPNMETLKYNPQWKTQVKNQSTSGWINFSYIINAMFPSRDSTATGDESNITLENGEIYLLVHRAWILVLAVLHCYAYRQDFGLPKENSSQDHIRSFYWKNTLGGLSGGLVKGPGAEGYAYDSDKLTFIMHPISTPCLLEEEADIRRLVLLSLGFVKMTDGTHLRFSSATPQHTVMPLRHNRVAQLVDDIASSTESVLSDMKLEVGKAKTMKVVEPKDVLQEAYWDTNKLRERGYMELGKFKPLAGNDDVWIHRGDAYRISAGYLSATFRRQGFLYPQHKDLIVSKLFTGKHTSMTLRWGQKWVSKLDLSEDKRNLLQTTMEKLSNLDLERTSWSREAMQSLYELDQAILDAWGSPDWKFRSISILSVCEESFRVRFAEMVGREEDDNRQFVRFSILNQKVELEWLADVGIPRQAAFDFEFTSVFAFDRPPSDREYEDLSIAQAVFAAIQGQIRAVMWKMSLSSRGAHDFLGANIYYISTRPVAHVRSSSRTPILSRSNDSFEVDSNNSSDSIIISRLGGVSSDLRGVEVYADGTRSQASHARSPGASSNYEMTLHAAARNGDEVDVRRWIEGGSNKDAKDSNGRTALSLAAANGNLPIVEYLASVGANLDVRDRNNTTPLSIAAGKGQLSVVQFLLDRGANSEVRDTQGAKALTYAASQGETAVVKLLLRHGSDKDAQDGEGRTALFDACATEEWEVAKVLLANDVDCNKATYIGTAPLHLAVARGDKAIVQLLLEKGADVSRINPEGKTAFQIAVWRNHEEICNLLKDWTEGIGADQDA